MLWAVPVAVVGAFSLALGSALQERDAVRAPGERVAHAPFLLHLFGRPRWLAGGALVVLGAGLHLTALSGAPLTVIQPLGVTGLLFAIVLWSAFTHRAVSIHQIVAGIAVMSGLTGVLWLFPHVDDAPVMDTGTALLLAGSVTCAGVLLHLAARWFPGSVRAIVLALAGGAAMGTTSGLARVVLAGTNGDWSRLISWLTLLAAGTAVFGALLVQNAYRSGHFAAAYATLLVTDPVVGVGIGAVMLGEGAPEAPLARISALLFALLAIAGTFGLARNRDRNPEAAASPRSARTR
ncbi:DMT family transporter [Nocardiopsis salina]|uniref:DMT family transporter n=1 Tax=Nocardiopsis salina TaxID=245836 RepID=UPI000344BD27|nr:DMT family transporter [Nocardiopsis salina]